MAIHFHFKDGTDYISNSSTHAKPYPSDNAFVQGLDNTELQQILVPTANIQYVELA
jgi:hypothetical protein